MATTHTLTRRSFVGSAGTAALAAGALATAPASALADQAATAAEANTDQAADELLYTASINPQDTDWRSTDTDMATLFSPWKLGPIEVAHRMVKSAAGSATYLAGYTDELFEYYLNFAKGGVSMIWVEGEAFTLGDDGTYSDEAIEFGKKLVAACAEYGSHLATSGPCSARAWPRTP